jgi:chromosome partitioning protein
MTVVVAFVSQKGGVGKSTLARALAAVTTRRGLRTTLADLDSQQQTVLRWQRLRQKGRVHPPLTVEPFSNVDAAIASQRDVDVLIVDAPGNATRTTFEVASVAHLVVQPCGACFDDLQPAVQLYYQLAASGVPKSRLLIALSRILEEEEEEAARRYIAVADFDVLPGAILERALYREAHNRGLAFIETPGDELNRFAEPIVGSILARILRKLEVTSPTEQGAGASA